MKISLSGRKFVISRKYLCEWLRMDDGGYVPKCFEGERDDFWKRIFMRDMFVFLRRESALIENPIFWRVIYNVLSRDINYRQPNLSCLIQSFFI